MREVLFVILVYVVGWGIGFMIGVSNDDAAAATKQCESELPRNQHCELIAVPVEE